jgi:hypothetical protein
MIRRHAAGFGALLVAAEAVVASNPSAVRRPSTTIPPAVQGR